MAASGCEWAHSLLRGAHEQRGDRHVPVPGRLALAPRAGAAQSYRARLLGADAPARRAVAAPCAHLSSLSPEATWRHHLRQEPDAVIPLVRIRGGGYEQSSSLLRLGGRTPHGDALVRGPGPYCGDGWIADPLDASMGGLAAHRRVRSVDDLPLAGLVGEAIADLKLHRQDLAASRRCRLALLLGPCAALSHGSRTRWRGRRDGPVRADRTACADRRIPPGSARRPPSGSPSRRSS